MSGRFDSYGATKGYRFRQSAFAPRWLAFSWKMTDFTLTKKFKKILDKIAKSAIIRVYQGKGNRKKPNELYPTWFARKKELR
jgi:hypothetical protein